MQSLGAGISARKGEDSSIGDGLTQRSNNLSAIGTPQRNNAKSSHSKRSQQNQESQRKKQNIFQNQKRNPTCDSKRTPNQKKGKPKKVIDTIEEDPMTSD